MGSLAIVALTLCSTAVAAADVIAPPGRESGRVDAEDQDSGLRVAGRALLSVPRVAVMLVTAPVRAALLVYDRYDLEPRFVRLFFSDDGRVGL